MKFWEEVLASRQRSIDFLLEPYIPRGGVVLLHGRKSLGKSPVGWTMGLSVAAGIPWCGLPVHQAPVLYIEVDTNEIMVVPRLKVLAPSYPPGIPFAMCFFQGSINILDPRESTLDELQAAQDTLHPGLVIVNTLRKVFTASSNDSEIPSQVYGAFQHIFPHAAFLFAHHDRKVQKDSTREMEREDLSGSLAWANDAQVVLHLVKHGKHPGLIRLDHTGSQVSELHAPLLLHLAEDGSNLAVHATETSNRLASIRAAIPPGTPLTEVDALVAEALGCSPRHARRLRIGH